MAVRRQETHEREFANWNYSEKVYRGVKGLEEASRKADAVRLNNTMTVDVSSAIFHLLYSELPLDQPSLGLKQNPERDK